MTIIVTLSPAALDVPKGADADCTMCDWNGSAGELKEADFALVAGHMVALGSCPNCGASAKLAAHVDIDYMAQRMDILARETAGATEGLRLMEIRARKAELEVLRLQNDVADLRRPKP